MDGADDVREDQNQVVRTPDKCGRGPCDVVRVRFDVFCKRHDLSGGGRNVVRRPDNVVDGADNVARLQNHVVYPPDK